MCRSAAKYDAPMNVKGAIKGGALDYEYRKKNLLHPWVLFNDFFLPIFILAFGFWTSVETLKLVFVSADTLFLLHDCSQLSPAICH